MVSGAAVNFFYPYSVLRAANVTSTEELLRLASVGRSKSLHFISTLHVLTGLPSDHLAFARILNV